MYALNDFIHHFDDSSNLEKYSWLFVLPSFVVLVVSSCGKCLYERFNRESNHEEQPQHRQREQRPTASNDNVVLDFFVRLIPVSMYALPEYTSHTIAIVSGPVGIFARVASINRSNGNHVATDLPMLKLYYISNLVSVLMPSFSQHTLLP
eukprot:TRINITY_DN1351_c0_g1_i1.p1 TRINITY_DN1351_c0_g1~~TRINITY_DN1351_c0_g1_i1.p1  ORF type:complete len:150 (-),score=11.40 TRINITY_DN1351_c0_g1_i1:691-1140(-)